MLLSLPSEEVSSDICVLAACCQSQKEEHFLMEWEELPHKLAALVLGDLSESNDFPEVAPVKVAAFEIFFASRCRASLSLTPFGEQSVVFVQQSQLIDVQCTCEADGQEDEEILC